MILIASLDIDTFFIGLGHMLGMGIVLVVLAVLWGLTATIGKLMPKPRLAAAPAVAATPAPVAPAPAPASSIVDEALEEVAAITAVVAMLLEDRAHRIVAIRSQGGDWSREGRREHHASHRIR